MSAILRRLQGGNLEVFKFGMYVLFPIGWMYYFGTNLDDRFNVQGFWPSAEQSHKIPLEKEEIDRELARMRTLDAVRREKREARAQAEAQAQFQAAQAQAEADAEAQSQVQSQGQTGGENGGQ